MEIVGWLFAKPFEVTQFWASDRYLVMSQQAGNSTGYLSKFCPEHVLKFQPAQDGDWFFKVCDGETGPFAGDFLPRILPTRNNIALLNDACIKASGILSAELAKGAIKGDRSDDISLLAGVIPYRGQGEMDILANEAFRQDLWKVFAEDWGLGLPPPDKFGIDPVTVSHLPGLPCAAAMVRSVLPILEVVHGQLEVICQSTWRVDERHFDKVEYRRADGQILVQQYDITEVFGRDDLDWKYFHF